MQQLSRVPSGRTRPAVLVLLALLALSALAGSLPAHAEGSRSLYPDGIGGSRASSEWRNSTYGTGLLRRTLLQVYANAGEFILSGSSTIGVNDTGGALLSDIRIYNPGLVQGATGSETIPASSSFSCQAQRISTGNANQGRITGNALAGNGNTIGRNQELAGPDTIINPALATPGGQVSFGGTNGYVPCFYQVPVTGIYHVAMYGTSGGNSNAQGAPTGEIGLTSAINFDNTQATSISAWDVTVRGALTSTVNQSGRLFASYINLFTNNNPRPMNSTVFVVTRDGYRYQVDLRGLDPNGFLLYGNALGYLDSDGITPLYRDIVATSAGTPDQLTNLIGGVTLAAPAYPVFFEAPDPAALTALGIPTTPVAPNVISLSFAGTSGGDTSLVGTGGTFSFTSAAGGVYQLIISRDGVDFEPSNPLNRVLRGASRGGAHSISWDGLDNNGVPFPAAATPYAAQLTLHGGEVHFPMLDVENSLQGGPTITLTNPPAGTCPPWNGGCRGAFYDDRGYRTLAGVVVGEGVNLSLCPAGSTSNTNDPAILYSGPNGYDTGGNQRSFGTGGFNAPNCAGAFGDKKGLDLWTYYPSTARLTNVNIVSVAADLAVVKSAAPPDPGIGQNVTFTIVATNNGPSNATGVVVNDPLPAGLTFVSATPSVGSYTSATGVWAIGPLANGASATLTMVATYVGPGQVINTATVTGNEPDPDPTNNTSTIAIPRGAADLGILKAVSNIAPNVGSNVTFTMLLTNNGPDNATGIEVTDQLPAGLVFVSATPAQGSYNAATGVWTVGALARGASTTLQIVATVTTAGSFVNVATISKLDQDDSNPSNNTSSSGLISQEADLAVLKTTSNSAPLVGSRFTYTIVATNNGPSNATGVTMTDLLPAGLTFVSATPSQGSYSAPTGIWAIGALANGASATLQIEVVMGPAASYVNSARITGDQPDPDPTNNTSNVPVAQPRADLAVQKTVDIPAPRLGANVQYSIVLTNNGPDNASGVELTDRLPAGLVLVSATPAQGSYDANSGVWTVGALANGASTSLRIVARTTVPGTLTNTARVTRSDAPDPDPNNNTSTIPITPQLADLSLSKRIVPPLPAAVGGQVTFEITVRNDGPSDATGIAVSEPLPAGLTFVSATPAQGTYDANTGIWNVGALVNGASTSLQVVATVTGAGPFVNVAEIAAADQPDIDSTPNNHVPNEDDIGRVTLSVPPRIADLELTKVRIGTNAIVGGNVSFLITVLNRGPDTATNVAVRDDLSAGLRFVSATPSQGSYDPASSTWTVGVLTPGGTASLLMVATIGPSGPYNNVAEISQSDLPDPDSTPNNSASGEDDRQAVSISTPTAIVLSSFRATREGGVAMVRWTTASELASWGFQLYRSADSQRAHAVRVTDQLIAARGRGQAGASYAWADTTATAGTRYWYWLQEIDINGQLSEYGPVRLAAPGDPQPVDGYGPPAGR